MTQIVGIIYRHGIVIASESQYTKGTQKTFDANKITILQFKNGDAIFAEGGSPATSNKAIKYISEVTKDLEIDSEDAIAKIVEAVMTRIRREILDTLQKRDYSAAEQDDIFCRAENYFALMFAYYYKPPASEADKYPEAIPCLFKSTLHQVICHRHNSYCVVGPDDRLAVFILKQFTDEEMVWGAAACLAVDALERIEHDDNSCGGDIVFATIDPEMMIYPAAAPFTGKLVERIRAKLAVMRKRNDERYKTELGRVMKKIHHEDFKQYKSVMEAEKAQKDKWRAEAPFTITKGCSKCGHTFQLKNSYFPADRKGVKCPQCGNIVPI